MKFKKNDLQQLGFTNKELLKLEKKHKKLYNNIEDIINLLAEFKITTFSNYLKDNSYLLDLDIYYLAKIIAYTFNKEQDYQKTLTILTKTKYGTIKRKRGIK